MVLIEAVSVFFVYYNKTVAITQQQSQECLGHKVITTTMNIYSHVLPSVAKEAAQKIGALVYDVG